MGEGGSHDLIQCLVDTQSQDCNRIYHVFVFFRACEAAQVFSFRDLFAHSFGDKYGIIVQITVGLTVTGTCISYAVLIGTCSREGELYPDLCISRTLPIMAFGAFEELSALPITFMLLSDLRVSLSGVGVQLIFSLHYFEVL